MGEYTIQPGDTLSKIAKMTGTTVAQLQKLNGIKNANLIFAGKTIQIPDIESDQAFNIKGLTVEQQIPKGEIRTVYAYIPPEDGKDDKDWRPPLLPKDDEEIKYEPVYAYKPPVDKGGKDDDGGNKWKLPWLPGDGNIKPVYAYVPPRDGDDDLVKPVYAYVPPKDGDDDLVKPVYAYVPPRDEDENPIKLVYAYIPPKDDVNPPQLPEPAEEPKITATAKDTELLEKRGASKTSNNPNGGAQFVVGDEAGEVSVTGNKSRPDSITIKDDTNGHSNTYTYRLITDKEIADGKTYDGIPLSKDQFKGANGPFYILIKAENEAGDNLKGSHTEVYRLEYTERDDGSRSYDLVQDEGMDGSGRSSMDYRRR